MCINSVVSKKKLLYIYINTNGKRCDLQKIYAPRKMNVGIYIKLVRPESGGGFTYVDELLAALSRLADQENHTFFLLCQGDGVIPLCGTRSIKIVKLGSLFWRRLITVLSVTHLGQDIQLVVNKKFSMIPPSVLKSHHIDMVWFPTGDLFGQLDLPYIATVWDSQHRMQPWFPEVSSGGQWLLRQRHAEIFLRQAAYVLVANNASRKEIERFYGISPHRIRTLSQPTPQYMLDVKEKVHSEILDKFNVSMPAVFYPAQLWPHKNHQLLVRAVHYLKIQYNVRISVLLPGSNKGNRAHIETLAHELGVSDQVHILGFISRNDLIFLYQNLLALAFPTYFGPENFPPLEAFAVGCPVVASNVHGAQEQYEDSALLFDPKDHRQLGELLKTVLENKILREDLIAKGSKRALKWTNDDYIREMLSIFDEFSSIRNCWPRI